MYANKNTPIAVGEVADEIPQVLRVCRDGRVERLLHSPFVPASEKPDATGVATRDVVINSDTAVAARLFLPSPAAATGRKLPVVVYFHGGAFLAESAFGRRYHRYSSSLAVRAGALIVTVEFRLAPEHPVPIPYDDAWTALCWVASFSDPWLASYADPKRMFVAGDSSGGSMAYHTAVRASRNGMDTEGLILVHPYFWGADRLPSELVSESFLKPDLSDKLWRTATAGRATNDDPRINPADADMASLRCRRVLVALAEKDLVRERGWLFAARMRDEYGWGANVTVVETVGKDHAFHLADRSPSAKAIELLDHIVEFINKKETSPSLPPGVQSSL